MTIAAGYLVDLRGIKFDDLEDDSKWIQALTVGTYDHPVHGKIEVTPERLQRFAANINNNVRETDLDVDYDHKAHSGDAAGWIKAAEARPNGLFVLVKWTKTALQKLKEGAYRYFSPEFVDEWKHPKTGQVHKDVLFGGGITNRPFLKDILPINMSEVVKLSGGSGMDPAEVLKEITALLKLPDDTDPGVVLGHIQAMLKDEAGEPPDPNDQQGGAPKPPAAPPRRQPPPVAADDKEKGKQMSEGDKPEDPLKALAEHPVVKQLMETVASQQKQLDEARVTESIIKLSEAAGSKGMAIPPAFKDELKKQLSETPAELRPGLIKLFETMIENGQVGVKLGETGAAGGGRKTTAADAYQREITKLMSENDKLSYADAAEAVATTKPQLYIDYQRELEAA